MTRSAMASAPSGGGRRGYTKYLPLNLYLIHSGSRHSHNPGSDVLGRTEASCTDAGSGRMPNQSMVQRPLTKTTPAIRRMNIVLSYSQRPL